MMNANTAISYTLRSLLTGDWFTRKDASRQYAKWIDTVLALGWLLGVTTLTLRSLSMGMP